MAKQITKAEEATKTDVKISKRITEKDFKEFHLKISAADISGVRNMLQVWGEALLINTYSTTALHLAAECSNTEILQAIIEKLPKWKKKFTLNSRCQGYTPVYKAVGKGLMCNIEILLANDVAVDKTSGNGETALFYAITRRDYNAAKLLLAKGASINKPNWEGNFILHLAVLDGDATCVREILRNGGEVDKKDITGKTALQLAIQRGYDDVSTILINHGASADCSVLKMAVESCYAGILHALLQHAAEIDAVDERGWTALHYAAYMDKLDSVHMLLENGAKVDHLTPDGKTAFDLAIARDHEDIVEILLNHEKLGGSNLSTALLTAVKLRRYNIFDDLLRRGANVDAVDEQGWSALHHAAKDCHWQTINILLQHGASINKKTLDNKTPLSMVLNLTELYYSLRSRGAE